MKRFKLVFLMLLVITLMSSTSAFAASGNIAFDTIYAGYSGSSIVVRGALVNTSPIAVARVTQSDMVVKDAQGNVAASATFQNSDSLYSVLLKPGEISIQDFIFDNCEPGHDLSKYSVEYNFRFSSGAYMAPEGLSVYVNGELLDVSPVIVNDRVMVPLRAIFEKLGASVTYENGVVTAVSGNRVIKHTVGEAVALVNGQAMQFDTPSTIIDGRTMIPARMVFNTIGGNMVLEYGQTDNYKIVVIHQF